MNIKKILKIVVPVAMLAGVIAIWFIQNFEETKNEISATDVNADFVLSADQIDIEALKAHNLPIIVDFGADSCVPCKEMAPVLETLNAEMQNKAIIKFIDVWKNPKASTGFPVQVIPTQFFFNSDGTPYVPSEEVMNAIDFTAFSSNDTDEHVFTAHQGGLTEEQMRIILADMGVE